MGVEHFEFDSSAVSRKGSKYQTEKAKINNNFDKIIGKELNEKKEIIIHNDIKLETSLENYYKKFKNQFLNHYKNVDSYIDNIKNSFNCTNKEISILFFVEDTSILGSYYLTKERNGRFCRRILFK